MTGVATVSHNSQKFAGTVFSVEAEDVLEADGAIFEAPIASALLTVSNVAYYSCIEYQCLDDNAHPCFK